MRKRLMGVLVATALLAFAGPATAKTDIPLWHTMGGGLGDKLNAMVKAFNESQSDYNIVPVYKGSYGETLTAAIAAFRAKQQPAIVQVFEVGTATMMAAQGAVYPVFQLLTDGRIIIGDRDVSRLEPARRDIAMVFQNYALYPHMNVYDNMAYGLRNRKVPKAEIDKRVRAAAQTLGLETMLTRVPRQLSGGQRQRVAMGRAIVRSPSVFLFDEPLSNLDAKLRVQMRGEIKRLQRQLGTTGVYVTHDQAEAMTMGDQLVVMREGRIEQIGSPLEVYHRPASVFVGGFIGSPSMNFLRGRVGQGGRQLRVADAVDISLPGAGLSGQEGRDLIVGIRPEHFRINNGAAFAELPVELVEPLGAQTLLEVRLGKEPVTVSVDGTVAIKPDDRVPLSFNPGELHLFDRATEARIDWNAA